MLGLIFVSYKFSSYIVNFMKILISISTIFILIIIFMCFISQFDLIDTLIILAILIFGILVLLYEKSKELILYIIYLIFTIFILILTSSDTMKQLHIGNYTPDILILKKEAKAIIPSGFLDSNNTLKKPKVLSNIGDEYYIELKTTPNKTLRLSIPKNLVLSEQNETEENMSQKTSKQEIIKSFQSILKYLYNSAD